MTHSKLRRTVDVEHRFIECQSSFDEVHRSLLASVPALKPEIWDMLARGEWDKVEVARRTGPKLWLFLTRNHGELTTADGVKSKAMQYEIGNPLTATRMTRHQLAAGLYAPLRVYLYEDAKGQVTFEYDLPSSLFGQFGDERVTAVGCELDMELEEALEVAAGLKQ
jgi:Domain of unknown function DUF302